MRNEQIIDAEIEGQELVPYVASNFTPEIVETPEQIKDSLDRIYTVLHEFMRDEIDYMTIRGKKSLTQAGGERLLRFFKLGEETEQLEAVQQWPHEGNDGFLYYHYRCKVYLLTPEGPRYIASGEGTANSKEAKWTRQSVYDVAHTIRSMARKRAFTAAVRRSTGTSEFYTDSLEDMPESAANPEPKTNEPTKAESGKDEDMVMTWGKYAGKALGMIAAENDSYLGWLMGKLQAKRTSGELPAEQVDLLEAVERMVNG